MALMASHITCQLDYFTLACSVSIQQWIPLTNGQLTFNGVIISHIDIECKVIQYVYFTICDAGL